MDRRKALKTIGYGAGAITVTPAVVGLFHSCQNNSSSFVPEYFNKNQFTILSQLMELILPETDIPGAWEKQDSDFQKALKNKINPPKLPKEALAYGFANQLRSLSITAFRTNEYIGENVLAYAPIPGEQRGCVDLMETTGGKIWSL